MSASVWVMFPNLASPAAAAVDAESLSVRRIEQIHRMHRACARSRSPQTGADLHETSRVSGGHEIRLRLGDMLQLGSKHRSRRIGLEQVVDAGGAAAVVRVRQRHQGK